MGQARQELITTDWHAPMLFYFFYIFSFFRMLGIIFYLYQRPSRCAVERGGAVFDYLLKWKGTDESVFGARTLST